MVAGPFIRERKAALTFSVDLVDCAVVVAAAMTRSAHGGNIAGTQQTFEVHDILMARACSHLKR